MRLHFYFLIEHGHKADQVGVEQTRDERLIQEIDNDRKFHVVWTGPRRIFSGQKVLKRSSPMDVSMGHEKEGYMPGNVNLRLPKKKPKEVSAALFYKF